MNLNRRVVHIGTAKHSACQLVYAIFDEWYCMLCTYYSELGGYRSLCVLLFSAFVTVHVSILFHSDVDCSGTYMFSVRLEPYIF